MISYSFETISNNHLSLTSCEGPDPGAKAQTWLTIEWEKAGYMPSDVRGLRSDVGGELIEQNGRKGPPQGMLIQHEGNCSVDVIDVPSAVLGQFWPVKHHHTCLGDPNLVASEPKPPQCSGLR